jgi:N utilization substance protein B
VSQHRKINRLIERTQNWTLKRMAVVDRNILRVAPLRMHCPDIPFRASLNEAIELAKIRNDDSEHY